LYHEISAAKPGAVCGIVPTLRKRSEEWDTHCIDCVDKFKGWAARQRNFNEGCSSLLSASGFRLSDSDFRASGLLVSGAREPDRGRVWWYRSGLH
jgi:hypothetical protein